MAVPVSSTVKLSSKLQMDQGIKEEIGLVELLQAKFLPWVNSSSCCLGVICMKVVCVEGEGRDPGPQRENPAVLADTRYYFDGSVKDKVFEG